MQVETPYIHKKFHLAKRKRSDDPSENLPQQTRNTQELAIPTTIIQADRDEQPAKRKKMQSFFRPWEDEKLELPEIGEWKRMEEENRKKIAAQIPVEAVQVMEYHSNKARSYPPRLRTAKEQEQRDRNTLVSLLNRRAQRAEELALAEDYNEKKQQLDGVREKSVRSSMYLRQLMLMAQRLRQQKFGVKLPLVGILTRVQLRPEA